MIYLHRIFLCLVGGLACGFLVGCETIPSGALALQQESLSWRQMQSRRFDTSDEKKIIKAAASLLQDLGFTIEESEIPLGVLVGSKDRSAVDGGQVAGAVALGILTGVWVPTDQNQKLRASVVTRPFGDGRKAIIARVTFQRVVWNTHGQISKVEPINDPKQYQEFFEKLSKSVFLNANEI